MGFDGLLENGFYYFFGTFLCQHSYFEVLNTVSSQGCVAVMTRIPYIGCMSMVISCQEMMMKNPLANIWKYMILKEKVLTAYLKNRGSCPR